MKRSILVCVTAVMLAGSAWAQDKAQGKGQEKAQEKTQGKGQEKAQKPEATGAQAPGMDISKMGSAARKPTNEKATKKEIEAFFKQQQELEKKGDMEAMFAAIDFPVYMLTDDLKGVPEAKEFSREEYVAMMKPMFEHMPKDMKTTYKSNITVLSDSLANVTTDFTTTTGKQKVTGRTAGLLVKRDGQWKWKSMVEAGWGGMPPPGATGGSQTPPEGTK